MLDVLLQGLTRIDGALMSGGFESEVPVGREPASRVFLDGCLELMSGLGVNVRPDGVHGLYGTPRSGIAEIEITAAS